MESRLDALAKALAQSGSRREAFKRAAGAAAAAALTAVGISCSPDDLAGPNGRLTRPLFATGRCKKNDHKCRQNSECCNGLCDPLTGVCLCGPGTVECPVSGQCVPECGTFEVLNPTTCVCECAPGLTRCGSSCVNLSTDSGNCGSCGHNCNPFDFTGGSGQVCVNGTCACAAGQVCSEPIFGSFCCVEPFPTCNPDVGCV